jgi:hypothetical protein
MSAQCQNYTAVASLFDMLFFCYTADDDAHTEYAMAIDMLDSMSSSQPGMGSVGSLGYDIRWGPLIGLV